MESFLFYGNSFYRFYDTLNQTMLVFLGDPVGCLGTYDVEYTKKL